MSTYGLFYTSSSLCNSFFAFYTSVYIMFLTLHLCCLSKRSLNPYRMVLHLAKHLVSFKQLSRNMLLVSNTENVSIIRNIGDIGDISKHQYWGLQGFTSTCIHPLSAVHPSTHTAQTAALSAAGCTPSPRCCSAPVGPLGAFAAAGSSAGPHSLPGRCPTVAPTAHTGHRAAPSRRVGKLSGGLSRVGGRWRHGRRRMLKSKRLQLLNHLKFLDFFEKGLAEGSHFNLRSGK